MFNRMMKETFPWKKQTTLAIVSVTKYWARVVLLIIMNTKLNPILPLHCMIIQHSPPLPRWGSKDTSSTSPPTLLRNRMIFQTSVDKSIWSKSQIKQHAEKLGLEINSHGERACGSEKEEKIVSNERHPIEILSSYFQWGPKRRERKSALVKVSVNPDHRTWNMAQR